MASHALKNKQRKAQETQGCARCGLQVTEQNYTMFHLHHLNPGDKLKDIAMFPKAFKSRGRPIIDGKRVSPTNPNLSIAWNKPWDTIAPALKSGILLCFTCHVKER